MYQMGIMIALVVVAAVVCGISYVIGEIKEIQKKHKNF